jgi:hypothetical protein
MSGRVRIGERSRHEVTAVPAIVFVLEHTSEGEF